MQGTIKGRPGIAFMFDTNGPRFAVGKFEGSDGETYEITFDKRGKTWHIERDAWDNERQDWYGEVVEQSWEAFAKEHGITTANTLAGRGRVR